MSGGRRGGGGGGGGGGRVQIPNSARKTIHNLKEISGNHSDEEIYATLKECNMDPNETAQKLLFQDPFHEVKSKRDKRKESLNNRESAESQRRTNAQGMVSKVGWAKSSPRYTSHDAGGGRSSNAEKSVVSSLPVSLNAENKEKTSLESSAAIVANGPTAIASGSTNVVYPNNVEAGDVFNQPEKMPPVTSVNNSEIAPLPVIEDKNPSMLENMVNSSLSMKSFSSSAVCFSSSDPVLVPTSDLRLSGAVGAIKREVGSNRASSEPIAAVPVEDKIATDSEIGSFAQEKMPIKFQAAGKAQMSDSSQHLSSSTHGGSSTRRPSSNHSNRSQTVYGPQKVRSNKEWKPKPTGPNMAEGAETSSTSDNASVPVETSTQVYPINTQVTSSLQKQPKELHLTQHQHVIIPRHIHVPESERIKLSFGSFDVSFGVTSNFISGRQSEKSKTPPSDAYHGKEEPLEEQIARSPNALETAEVEEEGGYTELPHSSSNVLENLSNAGDVSSDSVQEFNEAKSETPFSGVHQYSVVNASPNYNYGFLPQILGSQLPTSANLESQVRDASHLPSYIVQPSFDPAGYYAQLYRPAADSNGRISPFNAPGAEIKFTGNTAVLPQQNSQSPLEGGNLLSSAAGPTPLVTQAAGLMQSSIPLTQQPVPVFRPPVGLMQRPYDWPFPINYIPYGSCYNPQYSPLVGGPGAVHQFIGHGHGAFPQQPQASSVYPAPPASATGLKYPLQQYKSATNSGNLPQMDVPSGYVPYSSSPSVYNPSSAAMPGNSASNEDPATSQFKESIYFTGQQQSEGLGVWIAGPGRDMSSLPATSFYNLPAQGQHLPFAPSQAGHGAFAGIYHPSPAVTAAAVHPLLQQSQTMGGGAVDMVGPRAGVYQPPQHPHINWPSNY